MKFPTPIEKGHLHQRYKRFLADIELADGRFITAHCANPGSMLGVQTPGAPVWVTRSLNPKRKLKYDWQIIEIDNARVCINTMNANELVFEAITHARIESLTGYEHIRREVKYGQNSRIDILLSKKQSPDCYIEVKNVTLSRYQGIAEFPDSPTARGTKHLHELAAQSAQGQRTVMFYCINRTDCTEFRLARDIDPDYAQAFDRARAAGVEVMANGCDIQPDGITLQKSVEIGV